MEIKFGMGTSQTGKRLPKKKKKNLMPDYHIHLQWCCALFFGEFITHSWTTYRSFSFCCISAHSLYWNTNLLHHYQFSWYNTVALYILFLCNWLWYLIMSKSILFSILTEHQNIEKRWKCGFFCNKGISLITQRKLFVKIQFCTYFSNVACYPAEKKLVKNNLE